MSGLIALKCTQFDAALEQHYVLITGLMNIAYPEFFLMLLLLDSPLDRQMLHHASCQVTVHAASGEHGLVETGLLPVHVVVENSMIVAVVL